MNDICLTSVLITWVIFISMSIIITCTYALIFFSWWKCDFFFCCKNVNICKYFQMVWFVNKWLWTIIWHALNYFWIRNFLKRKMFVRMRPASLETRVHRRWRSVIGFQLMEGSLETALSQWRWCLMTPRSNDFLEVKDSWWTNSIKKKI